MAFEGDLTNLGLADIFQTLGMNRQSGTLVVKVGDTERRFYFTDEGASLLTSRSARKFRLGNLLVGMGKITEADLKVAVLKQERAKETKLGDILLQTGIVKESDIKEACKYQAAEEIYDSFNWKSGKFQFLEGANAGPQGGPGPFAEFFFGVTDIVMEAARRSDEFALNMQKIGDRGEFYVRKDPPPLAEDPHGRPAVLLHGMLDGSMDVAQVFEEFYLSPFDTSISFVKLIDAGLVFPMTPSQLQDAAKPLLEKKEFARAARLLGRAAHHAPRDGLLLQSLADAQAAAGAKKDAASSYMALGKLYAEMEQRTECVEALRKAVGLDPRLEAAYELLMDAHAGLDQFDKAEDAAREAARMRSDDRDFEGALRILDRGLRFVPESQNLRLQHANCLLAMGRKEEGLKAMADIATAMEERKADRKTLLGVYRKLEQIDPENRQFQEKVQALVAGEKAREARKKFLRFAAVGGGIAALGVIWLLRPDSAAVRLDKIEAFLAEHPAYEAAAADYDARSKDVAAILDGAVPGSDEDVRGRKVQLTISLRRTARERVAKVAALKKAIDDEILLPADDLLKKGDYPAAVRQCLRILPKLREPSTIVLQGPELDALLRTVMADVKGKVAFPADALRREWKDIQTAINTIGAVDIQKADDEKQKLICDMAGNALKAKQRADWKGTVEALVEAERATFPGMEEIRIEELRRILTEMDGSFGALESAYHESRAAVSYREVRTLYTTTTMEVKDAKGTGALARGIAACEAFLARCEALRREEPKKVFAPYLVRLFSTLKLDGEIGESLASLKGIQSGLDRAKKAEEGGELQRAFDLLRTTIGGAQDVNFQGLAQLPLRIESRPPGATIRITLPGSEPFDAGTTPKTLHYPYQGRTIVQVEMKGFEAAVLERTGIASDRQAVAVMDLQRSLRWRSMAGGAVEGRTGLAQDLVLVCTRAGLFRAFSREDGGEKFQLRTDHLSGISSGVLVAGTRAYFGGNDGEAFAVDIPGKAFLWRKKTAGPISVTPALGAGGIVAYADRDGGVYGFRADSGEQAWKADLKGALYGEIAAAGDLVLAGTADNRLVALKAADGTTAWSIPLSGPPVVMAADAGGGILVATEDAVLHRIALADGKETWTARTDGPLHARPLFRPEGILVATTRGTLQYLDPATGKEKSRQALGSAIEGGCAVLGDTLYVDGDKGVLIAYDLKTGRVAWQVADLGTLVGEPSVAEGILVVASTGSGGPIVVMDP